MRCHCILHLTRYRVYIVVYIVVCLIDTVYSLSSLLDSQIGKQFNGYKPFHNKILVKESFSMKRDAHRFPNGLAPRSGYEDHLSNLKTKYCLKKLLNEISKETLHEVLHESFSRKNALSRFQACSGRAVLLTNLMNGRFALI